MSTRDQNLNNVQIAALLGLSPATVSRAAARGVYGPAVIDPGQKRKRYSIAAIEQAVSRTFSAAEIEAASGAHDCRTTNPEIASSFLHRLLKQLIKARDDQWKAALAGQPLVNFAAPPTKGKIL